MRFRWVEKVLFDMALKRAKRFYPFSGAKIKATLKNKESNDNPK